MSISTESSFVEKFPFGNGNCCRTRHICGCQDNVFVGDYFFVVYYVQPYWLDQEGSAELFNKGIELLKQ